LFRNPQIASAEVFLEFLRTGKKSEDEKDSEQQVEIKKKPDNKTDNIKPEPFKEVATESTTAATVKKKKSTSKLVGVDESKSNSITDGDAKCEPSVSKKEKRDKDKRSNDKTKSSKSKEKKTKKSSRRKERAKKDRSNTKEQGDTLSSSQIDESVKAADESSREDVTRNDLESKSFESTAQEAQSEQPLQEEGPAKESAVPLTPALKKSVALLL